MRASGTRFRPRIGFVRRSAGAISPQLVCPFSRSRRYASALALIASNSCWLIVPLSSRPLARSISPARRCRPDRRTRPSRPGAAWTPRSAPPCPRCSRSGRRRRRGTGRTARRSARASCPAAHVAPTKHVADHVEQQHEPADPHEEDEHRPEHVEKRVVAASTIRGPPQIRASGSRRVVVAASRRRLARSSC